MRAIRVAELTGPDGLRLVDDQPEPEPGPDGTYDGVLVEVHASGVCFPDLLMSRGEYQHRPSPPFTLGSEGAGVVRSAPAGSELVAGDRVAAFGLGTWADLVVTPVATTFRLPDTLSYAEGAGLILNHHTAHFALLRRAGLRPGETVLVHGAAGGVGTAVLQVARAYGARTVAVVSSDAKEAVARGCGADEVVRSDGPGESWKDAVATLTDGAGVDVVVDPVGSDRVLDSLRSLAPLGRYVVVGFTGRTIEQVAVNRLLLRNATVVGAGWGAYALPRPAYLAEVAADLDGLVTAGRLRPVVGARYPLADAAQALRDLDGRRAVGKLVLEHR